MRLSPYQKALAALVGSSVAFTAAHFGLDIEGEFQAAIVTVITTVLVYLVPNRPQP